jgi:AcrR family transcriptional regulator
MLGLREIKKSQTREAIADAAGALFRQRGFDRVTIEDVAQAAQVSKKTVFNYFPSKEDLVFHRADDRRADLLDAVLNRPDGVSLLESFRQLCLRQTRRIDNLRRDMAPGSSDFFELVRSNPTLQRKMHEVHASLVQSLTDAIASQARVSSDDPLVATVATTLSGVQRTLFLALRKRVATGASSTSIAREHRRDVNRTFDLLQNGLGSYPHG